MKKDRKRNKNTFLNCNKDMRIYVQLWELARAHLKAQWSSLTI